MNLAAPVAIFFAVASPASAEEPLVNSCHIFGDVAAKVMKQRQMEVSKAVTEEMLRPVLEATPNIRFFKDVLADAYSVPIFEDPAIAVRTLDLFAAKYELACYRVFAETVPDREH